MNANRRAYRQSWRNLTGRSFPFLPPGGLYGARETSQGSSPGSDERAKDRAPLTRLPLRSVFASAMARMGTKWKNQRNQEGLKVYGFSPAGI